MTVTTWQCFRCSKLHIQLPGGVRGSAGHLPDLCAACSMTQAEQALVDDTPLSVQWLVARLRNELNQERKDRADDLRDMHREMRDR